MKPDDLCTIPDDFGQRLRAVRSRRGISLTVLAELSGLSLGFLSMVENGKRRLRRHAHVIALAKALRVPPSVLVHALPYSDMTHLPLTFPIGKEPDRLTRSRHIRLAREIQSYASRADHQAVRLLLRRLATDPTVSPWLLVEAVAEAIR